MEDFTQSIRQDVETIYKLIGADKCAAEMGVAYATAMRYQQPLSKNGEIIPLLRLHSLNAAVAKSRKADALRASFRIGKVLFSPLGAVVADQRLLKACSDGEPYVSINPQYVPPEVTEICSGCDDPVRYLPVCSCRWRKP